MIGLHAVASCCLLVTFLSHASAHVDIRHPIRTANEFLSSNVNVTKWTHHFEKDEVQADGTGCKCGGATYDCGCCADLNIPEIRLDNTVCVNFTYLPHDYGISVLLTVDGRVWFNYTVSARNPPPICLGIPKLEKEAGICVDFYNLDISQHMFSGCVKFEVQFLHQILAEANLGCFHIPVVDKLHYTFMHEPRMLEAFETLQKGFLRDLTKLREKKLSIKKDIPLI